MADADILTLGAGKTTTAGRFHPPTAQAKRIIDPSTGEAEELGDVTMMGALGVTALPAVPTSDGEAEGLCFQGVGGSNTGYCFAAHDPRAADVVGEMGPGDTCTHGTHADATNRAKVFHKDGLLALVVGNDLAMTFDRKNSAVVLSAFGQCFQVTADGITMAGSGGASLTVSDQVTIPAKLSVGTGASLPVAMSTPLVLFLGELETLLGTMATAIDGKSGTASATVLAVSNFVSAQSASLTAMPSKVVTAT